jgi:hypothetical protein
MKKWISLASLFATLGIFVFSLVATASDAQGVFVFVVTLPAMAALLSLSAWLSWRGSRAVRKTTLATALFVGAFFVFAPIPGLNLYCAGLMGAVTGGYKLIYGKSPYEAHRNDVDLPGLIYKALEADPATLDLTGLHLHYEWTRLCILQPHTSQEAAIKILGVPPDWPLDTYSRVALDEGVNALVLVGDRYPIAVADLKRKKVEFGPSAKNRCFAKDQAHFRKGEAGFEP